ncbi:MAG: homocitrate synthase/isopropylmalate synthase family protein [Candidatus Asgardarchaeia archaeon]
MINNNESHTNNINSIRNPNYFTNYFIMNPYNHIIDLPEKIRILDTTLREGEQAPFVNFSVEQRIMLARLLDEFGVNAIEISPIVSENHRESTRLIMNESLSAEIVHHLRALPRDIDVALELDAESVALFMSISDIHLANKLRISRREAVERIISSVEYAKAHGLTVRFTLEDASRADPEFLVHTACIAEDTGADRLSIPDTLGVLRPDGMYRMIRLVRDAVNIPLDVHCHNDLGLALANALAGIEAGATQVHATIDGIGERVGITSLAEVVVSLYQLYGIHLDVKMELLTRISDLLHSFININLKDFRPIVGRNAFRHKSGTHLLALLNNPASYEVIPPEFVGNRRRVLFGSFSGRNGVRILLQTLGVNVDDERAAQIVAYLKKVSAGDLFEIEYNLPTR